MTNTNTISLDLLATVTGGCGTAPSIPEDGGVAGPVGSPTPKFGRRTPKSHADELRDGNGGIVPKLPDGVRPIPESGGIAGPVGSPTPF